MTLVPKKANTTGMPSRTRTKKLAISSENAVYHSMTGSQMSPPVAVRLRRSRSGPALLAQELDQPQQASEWE